MFAYVALMYSRQINLWFLKEVCNVFSDQLKNIPFNSYLRQIV